MKNGIRCTRLTVSLALLLAIGFETSQAQHSHGRKRVLEIEHDTLPMHDEVLEGQPEYLILRFNDYVRLAKFTLKADDVIPVDIGFKFDVKSSRVFTQILPELAPAAYYTAEWAAITEDNKIYTGHFCFSFGPGAVPPTQILEALEFPETPF